jgi:hemerythrin superfamily protein
MNEGYSCTQDDAIASGAITFLESQHQEIEQVFERIDALDRDDVERKFALLQRAAKLILHHSQLEEAFFFPLIVSSGDPSAIEDDETHYVIKRLLSNIETGGPRHQYLQSNITILREIVLRHFKREESLTFPNIRQKTEHRVLLGLGAKLKAEYCRLAFGS